jgi:hypothetical protein
MSALAKTGLMHRSKSALLNHVVAIVGMSGGTRIGDFKIEGIVMYLVGVCTGRGRSHIISASSSTAAIPMIKSANAAKS